MSCRLQNVLIVWLALAGMVSAPGQENGKTAQEAPASQPAETQDPIDFDRARGYLQRRNRGESLTSDEQAYLLRAMEARRQPRASQPAGQATFRQQSRESTGLKPLTEMRATDVYKGEDGGLYGGGRNTPPAEHHQSALDAVAGIRPLNARGRPAVDGQIGFVSISMSNATQEFSWFKRLADADPRKSDRLTIVDCAQGGQAMAEWVEPRGRPWQEADRRLNAAGVTADQVQVAWIKLANKGPRGELEEHGRKLQQDSQAVIQNARARFPNLQLVLLSSRIYGGYAVGALNPEPYAYESAFVVRWLINDQIQHKPALNPDARRGPVKAPVLLWGPYLWADGITPRQSDGLLYNRADLASDGTHPSDSGRDKVARQLLDFCTSSEFAVPWFCGTSR